MLQGHVTVTLVGAVPNPADPFMHLCIRAQERGARLTATMISVLESGNPTGRYILCRWGEDTVYVDVEHLVRKACDG